MGRLWRLPQGKVEMKDKADSEIQGILGEAFGRYRGGEKTYGVFDKCTDTRDFFNEAEEELLDMIVYAAFQIAKLRALKEKMANVKPREEGKCFRR